MDHEFAMTLNAGSVLSAHGRPFSGDEVHLLRKHWNLPTVKIDGTDIVLCNGLTKHIPFKEPLRLSDFYADRLQMAAERSIVGPPAGQRNALADHTFEPADRRIENPGVAHKSIGERSIMGSSGRRTPLAIRRTPGWS